MSINNSDSYKNLIGNALFYALVDRDEEKILGLMVDYRGLGAFYRQNRRWVLVPDDEEELEQAGKVFIRPDKAFEFVDKLDTEDSELYDELDYYEATPEIKEKYFPGLYSQETVTAAAGPFTCPPATQDIMLNLENRKKAINSVGYGPMNPDRPNVDFWEEKAKTWGTTADEAKTSRCANCAMFIRTPSMLQCIEEGLAAGDQSDESAWGAIDAGDLGYCEAFDFKCAAARTCDAWVAGGPVTKEK